VRGEVPGFIDALRPGLLEDALRDVVSLHELVAVGLRELLAHAAGIGEASGEIVAHLDHDAQRFARLEEPPEAKHLRREGLVDKGGDRHVRHDDTVLGEVHARGHRDLVDALANIIDLPADGDERIVEEIIPDILQAHFSEDHRRPDAARGDDDLRREGLVRSTLHFKFDARRPVAVEDDVRHARLVQEHRAHRDRLLRMHARAPLHPVFVAVVAEFHARPPAILIHELLERGPRIPKRLGALHDTPRHRRDHLVLERGDGKLPARLLLFAAHIDPVFLEHIVRHRKTCPVVEQRAPAGRYPAHHPQKVVGNKHSLSGKALLEKVLYDIPLDRTAGPPLEHEHLLAAFRKLLRDRGATRTCSDDNGIEFHVFEIMHLFLQNSMTIGFIYIEQLL